MPLPPEIHYLRTVVNQRLASLRSRRRDQGSLTVEWMIIGGSLFLGAIWAAARIYSVIRDRGAQIK